MTTAHREFRIFQKSELRTKKKDQGPSMIEGHAAVFNSLSEDLGGWRERIMPGAFSEDLASKPDVRALFNHDPNIVLGRTTSKTLRLSEDTEGLYFEADPPDTQVARDVVTSIDRGDISQCSFGFYVKRQKWAEEPDPDDATGKAKMIVREVHAAKVFDVSPVTYPAYTATDVSSRSLESLFPDGVPGEVRSHVPALDRRQRPRRRSVDQCECDCDPCEAGTCALCTNPDCTGEEMNCIHGGERAAAKPDVVIIETPELERLRMLGRLAEHDE
ncbi:MAG TPA: HK97 family phage prohead protease [Candidatus Acidoferrum sp.]|jgi:hypothetical protein|nr:HK97 family phage prohead protease [Candidatus Acidoferrum sp.]